ncbi:MAG: amidohydrolase [Oscillospiraceae bacterium]|nr:amidohydrolase [Oscillospiraceae bacterium]
MDILFQNVTAVTMDDSCRVLKNAYIGVDGGKISYVGCHCPEGIPDRKISGNGKVLMPGLINSHTHVPMTLLRGYADDCNLQDWLFKYIFPAEEKLTGDMVYWGSQLAILEMLASGTTAFADMYFFCHDIARAVSESGILANISRPLTCFGESYDYKSDCRYRELEELAESWHGYNNGQIMIDSAIHGEYTSIPSVWEAASEIAERLGLGMHVHISETQSEHQECIARHKMTPAAVLCKYGTFSSRTIAAHCVWATHEDIDLLARHGVIAVHNPVSNLKLGSGIAPVLEMKSKGVPIALGTDGAGSNNSYDLFEEIKLTALLHRSESDMIGAFGSLQMACRGGALALGRESTTGQISLGYDADLILLDFNTPSLTPCHNTQSHLVYSARGSDVVMTMVGGKVLYENGEFKTIDKEKVLHEASVVARIF